MTSSRTSPKARKRADKKELSRRRREELRRRQQRARFIRTFGTLVVISTVIALGVALLMRPDEPTERPERLPSELRTEAPWPANTEELAARLDVLGLPGTGDAQHVHANLRIFVNGEPVTVPVNIGLDGDLHAALHTHDELGTIHVESATRRDFTLGELFDVWGVRLTGSCLGGYCAEGSNRLQAFVGGTEVSGGIRDIVLDDGAVLVLTFGTPDELPDPIPSTFDFTTVEG